MTDEVLPDWDRIVERHAQRVFRVALRILRSVQDAEDVSQDVFTEAFRLHKAGVHAAVFAPDGATLATGSEDQTLRLHKLPEELIRPASAKR